jgi:tetratricopeptide (TPR) repeat protein
MKSFILLLVGLGIGLVGSVIYFRSQQAPVPPQTPGFESTPTSVAPQETVVATPVPAPVVIEKNPETVPAVAANPVKTEAESEATAAFRKTIDALLAPQFASQKQELFDRLRTSGQMDAVITELQARVKDSPGDANLHTTLGEAMLNKVRLLHETGADVNEQGILAMQADQSFTAALKADPTNWEAQFVKYSTQFYWPADAKRDGEAAQKLSSLIDQQEALPPQPHFVQTYVALGNQYQKMGKPDFAEATWQLGLTKFPNDPTLLKKLAPRQ